MILFIDGHYSHIDLELIYTAREHNVHVMCLPPNLLHIMQPLDSSFKTSVFYNPEGIEDCPAAFAAIATSDIDYAAAANAAGTTLNFNL